MITNFIKDNEPLKWKFRDNALKLLSLNRAFTTVSLSERKELIKEYQSVACEIVSLSDIASRSGLVSEMNGTILSREFNSLIALMEKDENKKAHEETVSLSSGFFQVTSQPLQGTHIETPVVPVQDIRDNVLYNSGRIEQGGDKGHVAQTNTESVIKKPEYLPLKEVKEKAPAAPGSKDNRQSIIIKMLSKKGGLNIKDFGDSIKGVSAKTIQRELLSMVASGVLKKEGERRWSTYSLA
jgi:hypothetical protein